MLEAGSRKRRKQEQDAATSDDENGNATGSEGSDEKAAGDAGEGLLPTEDAFLRLDDMEAFVQVQAQTA